MKTLGIITTTLVSVLCCTAALAKPVPEPRIISAGNGITEIIYALGAGDQVIAVDSTSVYPPEVHALPKLGYHKQLSAEGILALNPSIVIGSDDIGPDTTIDQLKNAGVDVAALPLKNTTGNIHYRIKELAKLLGREEAGEVLWQSIEHSLSEAKALYANKEKPNVVFLLAMGDRTPSVSGNNTSANALIELAGGHNPAAEQFASYKPLSNEALLMMMPDVILYSDRGDGLTPDQLISMQPILKQTPAGKNKRLIAIDPGRLLGGLGPRTGELALELAQAFYPPEK